MILTPPLFFEGLEMTFEWDDSLSVGVEEIDRQHRELIRRLDLLAEAVMSGRGKDRIKILIDFMESYAEEHFATEERYMEMYSYPGTDHHRREHARFWTAVMKLRDMLESEGETDYLAVSVERFLMDWLILHIKNTDMEFGRFLRDKV